MRAYMQSISGSIRFGMALRHQATTAGAGLIFGKTCGRYKATQDLKRIVAPGHKAPAAAAQASMSQREI